ncbi:MAG: SpoIIE family protein phosphatase [candidate division Zixibacteria bacterium]|nr:SpoIIE family protein phosphatase [candidate division Zixibacteria bacterium]
MLSRIEDQIVLFERKLFDLESKLADQAAQLEDIARMGLMITSLIDLESVLAAMMEMAIRMVSGEVGSIMLIENERLQTRISWGVDDAVIAAIRMEDGRNIADWALATGEATILRELGEPASMHNRIESVIAVPVISKEKKIGVLVIVNKATGGEFDEEDRMRLQLLVRFAAVAIENASLIEEKLHAQKLEQELFLAHTVQHALLPAPSATFNRAIIEAAYIPAGQVGGDYYDIIKLTDDEFVVIVGDVTSKGVPAALLMAAVRSAFRLEAVRGRPVDQLITGLNQFLCEQVLRSENMFISVAYAHFNLAAGTCAYVNAGHLPPAHLQKESGQVREWRVGGTVLGQFADVTFKSETVELHAGDRILFYTDGVSESENQRGDLYGRQRVLHFLRNQSDAHPVQVTQRLMEELGVFRAGANRASLDDTTILAVEIR